MIRLLPILFGAAFFFKGGPTPPPAVAKKARSYGAEHTCTIFTDGAAKCWGRGDDGALGQDSIVSLGDNELPSSYGAINLGAGRTAKAIAAGQRFTCAILDNDTLKCWGKNDKGQLGYGDTTTRGTAGQPMSGVGTIDLGSGRYPVAIAAGYRHVCAILDNGNVKCWGEGTNGQLGYDATNDLGNDEVPGSYGTVNLGSPVKAIAAGYAHTCAILATDDLKCWGKNLQGQLGYGDTADRGHTSGSMAALGTVNLGAGVKAKAVAAGEAHTCVITQTDQVKCWGLGSAGRLGYSNTNTIGDDETPASVGFVSIGGNPPVDIAAGQIHTCVVLQLGAVRCWGIGLNGVLGYGNTNNIGDDELPSSAGDVTTGTLANSISAATSHTCILTGTQNVMCWGLGLNGRLGYGNGNAIGDTEFPSAAGSVSAGAFSSFIASIPLRDAARVPLLWAAADQ